MVTDALTDDKGGPLFVLIHPSKPQLFNWRDSTNMIHIPLPPLKKSNKVIVYTGPNSIMTSPIPIYFKNKNNGHIRRIGMVLSGSPLEVDLTESGCVSASPTFPTQVNENANENKKDFDFQYKSNL